MIWKGNQRKNSGMIIAIVLFFAFAIAIFMVTMIGSNTNLSMQNKAFLRQLQAYYLAQSGLQHALLKVRLLPKETRDALTGGDPNPFSDVASDLHPGLNFTPSETGKYDLFKNDPSPNVAPFRGNYELQDITTAGSQDDMKFVQDGYRLSLKGQVFPLFPRKNKDGTEVVFKDNITEDVIVSRFTGGIETE